MLYVFTNNKNNDNRSVIETAGLVKFIRFFPALLKVPDSKNVNVLHFYQLLNSHHFETV